jgi:transketolase
MSDGECDEGTTWESALIANHHKIGRLVVIVDRNRLQSMGDTEDTLALEPFAQKWLSFGWKVLEIDGHDYQEIFDSAKLDYADTPICIIANTTKGKGVTFMEHSVLWHYRTPTEIELEQGLAELGQQKI